MLDYWNTANNSRIVCMFLLFFLQIITNAQDTDTKRHGLLRAGQRDRLQIAPHFSEESLINTDMQQ